MLKYTKFFDLLKERGIKQIDLREQGVHPRIFQKLQKSEEIQIDTEIHRLYLCISGVSLF